MRTPPLQKAKPNAGTTVQSNATAVSVAVATEAIDCATTFRSARADCARDHRPTQGLRTETAVSHDQPERMHSACRNRYHRRGRRRDRLPGLALSAR